MFSGRALWATALLSLLLLASPARASRPLSTDSLLSLFSTRNKLSEKQAESVVGVWNTTFGMRVDGSVFDGVLLEAASAAKGGGKVDFDDVMAGATTEVDFSQMTYKLFIPSISRKTGIFVGYYLITKSGGQPTMARVVGVGAATAEGVMLMGSKDEDTGTLHCLVKGDGTMSGLYLEGLEALDGKTGDVLDNQVAAVYKYKKMGKRAVKAALDEVVAAKAAGDLSHSQLIAAQDKADKEADAATKPQGS